MDTPTEKLNDSFLENIAGGSDLTTGGKVALGVGGGLAGGVLLSGLGCLCASLVYDAKADRAYNHGDYDTYEKYHAKANRCLDVGSGLASLGFAPALEKYRNS